MCGRITQHRAKLAYAMEMGWNTDAYGEGSGDRVPNWNVPPGSNPWLMHRFGGDQGGIDMVHWGYRPSWAGEKGMPVAINSRLEKAATGSYFRSLFKSGRAIVPADGWYEWTGPAGKKQPWYIRLKSDRPMFLAAITDFRPEKELREDSGFVIVTAAAEGGLVDVHDRRPVVLAPDDAALWMDNDLSAEQAEQLARSVSLGPDAFDWYPVSKDVNKVGTNDRHLIDPVTL